MYLISVTSNKNATLRDLTGSVLKVKFKATAEPSGAIKIQDSFAGTAVGVKYPFENKDIITIAGNVPASLVDLKGEVKDGSLVFTFTNTSGKTIANCNFQLQLPEGVTVKPKGKKYEYEEGDATEGMTFSIAFKNDKYTITVYDGEFDETAGNTIITLPLEGELSGEATVSNIAFGDPDGNNISRPEAFTIKLGGEEVPSYPVDLFGKVENGALVFTFKNNSGKTIANCNFQLQLPEGVSVKPKGKKYEYEEGDATEGMTFSIAFKNDKYTITVYDGEFDETAGNTIITLPLEGTLSGDATVSNIAFGDPDGNNISRPETFTISLADAINSISADETKSGVIYNMNGQRVSKATKGIFIIDGKKVAVK